ncbi:MAG: hypothetical protein IKD18_02045 [Clostridia bacterium]|nr:hypothetical protein [Clostridia bacterium]
MNQSYSCIPKKEDRKAKVLCFVLFILAVSSFVAASYLPAAKGVGQLFAALLLLLFIQITTKFLLTEYCYHWENDTLYISAKQGGRIKNQGGVPVHSRCILLTAGEWKKTKKQYRIESRFSYLQNLSSPRTHYLLCPGERGYVCLIFEPDETLFTLLKEKIASVQEEQPEI